MSVVALVVCTLLVACGTEEKPGTNAPTTPPQEQVPTSVAVTIAQMKFQPDTLRLHRGDTVVFTNKDMVDHDVTQFPDSSWTSGPLHTGESWKWVADKSAAYFCSIHVVMRGEAIVE